MDISNRTSLITMSPLNQYRKGWQQYSFSIPAIVLSLYVMFAAQCQPIDAHSSAHANIVRSQEWLDAIERGEQLMRAKDFDEAEKTLEMCLRSLQDEQQDQATFVSCSHLLAGCYRQQAAAMRNALCKSLGFPGRLDLIPILPWGLFLLGLIVLFLPDSLFDVSPTSLRHRWGGLQQELAVDDAIAAELGRTLPSPFPKFIVLVIVLGLSGYAFYVNCIAEKKDAAAAKLELAASMIKVPYDETSNRCGHQIHHTK